MSLIGLLISIGGFVLFILLNGESLLSNVENFGLFLDPPSMMIIIGSFFGTLVINSSVCPATIKTVPQRQL